MTRTTLLFIALIGLSSAGFAAGLELSEPAKEHAEWQATGELGDLLEKMAASNKASQEVFAELSAEQMNWQPPNGTHTPRWNAEHMMSIQLLFFSQVFAAIDPEHHELIKINPKQMPGDYVAAHPDWTGEQEAEQMQQISDYIQGHAYLLKDLDLDAKPPGSRWVLRVLLKRMDSHYAEHTANVVKKFELAGWPKQTVVAE